MTGKCRRTCDPTSFVESYLQDCDAFVMGVVPRTIRFHLNVGSVVDHLHC